MSDKEFFDEIKQANTPRKILTLILENEEFFGYDPYFADLRKAMLDQVEWVLSNYVTRAEDSSCGFCGWTDGEHAPGCLRDPRDHEGSCPDCGGTGAQVVNTGLMPEHGNLEQESCDRCGGTGLLASAQTFYVLEEEANA